MKQKLFVNIENFRKQNKMEICRICEGPAQYDIFNSELIFEEKKTIKIYIILNNFLYDKVC